MKLLKVILVVILFFCVNSCSSDGNSSEPTDDRETIIPETTKPISDEDITDNVISFSQDSSIITFNSSVASTYNFVENDVLVSQHGNGMLRKITSVQSSGDQIILYTEQASLTDAIEKGRGSVTTTLSKVGVNKILYLREGVILNDALLKATSSSGFNFTVNTIFYDADGNDNTTDDQISATGSFNIDHDFDMIVDIDNWQLRQFSMEVVLNEESNLEFQATAQAQLTREIELARLQLNSFIIWIGMIPIVIVPEIVINVGADCQLNASLTTSVSQTVAYTAGLNYDIITGWTPNNTFDNNYSFESPTLTHSSTAKAYIAPDLIFKIYNVIGPYVTGELYGEIVANNYQEPWWELFIGVNAGIGARMEIFDKTIFDHSKNDLITYRHKIAEAEVAFNQSPTDPSNPTPSNEATDISTETSLSWSCTDPDGDPLTYDVYFGTDSTPDSGELVSSNQSNTTYNPGTLTDGIKYYWKIVVTDDYGNSTTGSIWNFTTAVFTNSPPTDPSNPTPSNEATDISTETSLSWSCTDPDGDPITYDVYFGTDSTPDSGELVSSDQSNKTYDPGTLIDGETYYWQIIVKDDQGNSTTGSIWNFTTAAIINSPPTDPSNPTPSNEATDISTETSLSWSCTDPDGDPLTYDVYFGTEPTPDSDQFVSSSQESSTYDPGTLIDGETYYWQIIAKDDQGNSTTGSIWNFSTSAIINSAPNQPSNPNPSDNSVDQSTSTNISWDCSDPDGDPLTYDVYFGTDSSPDSGELVSSGQSSKSYDPGILADGQKYYWIIVANDDHGNSTAGNKWDFTTAASVSTEPEVTSVSPLVATLGVETIFTVTGTNLTNQLGYHVDDLEDMQFVSLNTAKTEFEFKGMPSNTAGQKNGVIKDQPGGTTLYTFLVDFNSTNNPPSTPVLVSPSNNATGQSTSTNISWSCSDPDGDPLTYDVYFGTDSSPDSGELVSSSQSSTTYDPGTLTADQTYYWKIVVKDDHDNTTTGSIWNFTTAAIINSAPNQPSNPNPSDNSVDKSTSTNISWSCSDSDEDPLTYDVYFGTDSSPDSGELVSSGQSITTYDPGTLTADQTYYWKIIAKDDHGNSTTGSIWNFKTISTSTCNGVQIGEQCWASSNLNVGTMIQGNENPSDNGTIEKYCYDNDPSNCTTYGGLYQWNEAMNYVTTEGAKGICPSGWHIPTSAELRTLEDAVGDDANALKAVGQGIGDGTGTNTSGFSALLAGERWSSNGSFNDLGKSTTLWSSTETSSYGAAGLGMDYDIGNVYGVAALKGGGASIRCLKD